MNARAYATIARTEEGLSSVNKEKLADFECWDKQRLALTYDDVRLRTGLSHVSPNEVDTTSYFSRNVELKVPIASAAMDTVTESRMAITMAKLGGIGVIHAGLSIRDQRDEVRRVKYHLNGLIEKPIEVADTDTMSHVLEMCDQKNFDFRTFPVIDQDNKFMGLLTQNDFDFCDDKSQTVAETMTPLSDIVSASSDTSVEGAYKIMKEHKKKTLPLLNTDGSVAGLYILSDVLRVVHGNPDEYNLDQNGRLRVAAAVPTDPEEAVERMRAMEEYVDVVVVDTAQGDSSYAFDTLDGLLKARKTLTALKEATGIDIVVGNVSEGESARELVLAGADGIKVGQGPGSICTTRPETGIGTPQVTAVNECYKEIRRRNGFLKKILSSLPQAKAIPICADGGITNPGDISIAIAAGADSVMLGGMLAGTKEAPGEITTRDGKMMKLYRGMGSPSALRDNAASRKRYSAEGPGRALSEGVEKYVPYRGSAEDPMEHYTKALRKSMSYVGAADIRSHQNSTRLRRITNAGLRESNVHDVQQTAR